MGWGEILIEAIKYIISIVASLIPFILPYDLSLRIRAVISGIIF